MQQPFTSGRVSLGGSGGYAIDIRAPGGDVVFLRTFNNPQQELPSGAEAVYAVHPTSLLSSGVLAADFGQLGFISLSFVPHGKPRVGRVPRGCGGRRPRNAQGSYQGTISLHGENGLFEIERVRAGGTRHRSFRLVCAKGRARHPEVSRPLADYLGPAIGGARENGSHLEAVSEANGRHLAFLAEDFPATRSMRRKPGCGNPAPASRSGAGFSSLARRLFRRALRERGRAPAPSFLIPRFAAPQYSAKIPR